MYLIYLTNGTVIATSTEKMADCIFNREDASCMTFEENVDRALEVADYVEE